MNRPAVHYRIGLPVVVFVATLSILTGPSREWILTGWALDRDSSVVEWVLVVMLGLVSICAGVTAHAEWRRTHERLQSTSSSSNA